MLMLVWMPGIPFSSEIIRNNPPRKEGGIQGMLGFQVPGKICTDQNRKQETEETKNTKNQKIHYGLTRLNRVLTRRNT